MIICTCIVSEWGCNMIDNIIDEKLIDDVKKFSEKFSQLSIENQKIIFHTINCMLMLQKAREVN